MASLRAWSVIAKWRVHEVLALHPTPWFCVFEALSDDRTKVLKAAHHKACVDIVVMVFGDSPVFLLGIVDEKSDVGGDISGLDGGEISAFDYGTRVGVTHFNCPCACAGANIQDIKRRGEGCKV